MLRRAPRRDRSDTRFISTTVRVAVGSACPGAGLVRILGRCSTRRSAAICSGRSSRSRSPWASAGAPTWPAAVCCGSPNSTRSSPWLAAGNGFRRLHARRRRRFSLGLAALIFTAIRVGDRLVPGWNGAALWVATAVIAAAVAVLGALLLGSFGLLTGWIYLLLLLLVASAAWRWSERIPLSGGGEDRDVTVAEPRDDAAARLSC